MHENRQSFRWSFCILKNLGLFLYRNSPSAAKLLMISVKRFVTERAVDFITILEEDFPRQCY